MVTYFPKCLIVKDSCVSLLVSFFLLFAKLDSEIFVTLSDDINWISQSKKDYLTYLLPGFVSDLSVSKLYQFSG